MKIRRMTPKTTISTLPTRANQLMGPDSIIEIKYNVLDM